MIKKNSENFRIMRHFLNVGSLTAVDACKQDISNNLRSRVPELQDLGFDIISKPITGKAFCVYSIPAEKLERNRELFGKHTNAPQH